LPPRLARNTVAVVLALLILGDATKPCSSGISGGSISGGGGSRSRSKQANNQINPRGLTRGRRDLVNYFGELRNAGSPSNEAHHGLMDMVFIDSTLELK